MRLLIINSVLEFGSTGRIALDIAREYKANGYEVKIAYGRKANNSDDALEYGIRIGNSLDVYCHVLYTRLTDKHGLASKRATKKFLKWADEYNPEELWIHNIHDYYINYELLFEWIKKRPQMKVKWTFHDCWPFTGHCSHFSYVKCDKWKEGCFNCPQLKQYPKSITDNSIDNYSRKKKAFTGVNDLKIFTPSNWLKELVQESFLSDYSVEVLNNKIDTDIFKPTASSFKEDYDLRDKKMILGVASVWDQRKGLYDFIELSKKLNVNIYKIVLVGLSEKQLKELRKIAPDILGLPRTNSAGELAKIYSAADIFVNPSYEETFGLTTAEAQACGTFSVVYKGTACEEIMDKNSGIAVTNIEEVYIQIQKIV